MAEPRQKFLPGFQRHIIPIQSLALLFQPIVGPESPMSAKRLSSTHCTPGTPIRYFEISVTSGKPIGYALFTQGRMTPRNTAGLGEDLHYRCGFV